MKFPAMEFSVARNGEALFVLYKGKKTKWGIEWRRPGFQCCRASSQSVEMKARLFLLGDFTSDLSYSDVEENQFWEMVRSYFRKRLDQSEAHECLWDHSPAF